MSSERISLDEQATVFDDGGRRKGSCDRSSDRPLHPTARMRPHTKPRSVPRLDVYANKTSFLVKLCFHYFDVGDSFAFAPPNRGP